MTHRHTPTLAAWLLCLGCIASPASQAKDDPEPVALDAGFKAAEMAGKLFTVTEAKALKGVTKVAVPLFTVEFLTEGSVKGETSGFGSVGRASTAMHFKLLGLEEADYQGLTNALHQQFITDLKAAGMAVVPQDQVVASPSYKKLAASGVPSPIRNDAAISLSPLGMPIYGFNIVQAGGGLFGAMSSIGAGFGAVGTALDSNELQRELGAALLEVKLAVHFVQLVNHNKGFLGRMSDTASVEGTVMPIITTATYRVQSSVMASSLTLANPLMLDKAAFASVREKPGTTADMVGAVAVGLLMLATKSSLNSSSTYMEAFADPARYRDIVGTGLGTVNQMFIQRLTAGE